jgi:hypothetical protein
MDRRFSDGFDGHQVHCHHD